MAETLKFTKMHGLGNDFILVDGQEIAATGIKSAQLAINMCDRHSGIGADGLIIINPVDINNNDADISWRILNSDGSEPQMCGNGIRCFARYVYDQQIVNKKKFSVKTLAGIVIPEVLDNGQVRVDMGAPKLEARRVPVAVRDFHRIINFPIEVRGKKFNINAVSMGNPHCIIFTDEDTAKLAREYGPDIEVNTLFPEKTNVEFVKILSRDNIKIDVWERGCGITLACGTGACASTVAAIVNNFVDNTVNADLPGGRLKIEWNQDNQDSSVYMTGGSEYVFHGEYLLTK